MPKYTYYSLFEFKMCFKKKISPSMVISENELPKIEIPEIDLEIQNYLDSLKNVLDPEKLIGDSASDYLSQVRKFNALKIH